MIARPTMKRLVRLLWTLAAAAGIVAVAGGAWIFSQGIGTRTPPSRVEVIMSRAARHAMIPRAARERRGPEPATAETARMGMEHWADHCATCHANDGSGDTEIGRGLYPRAPDMRLPETQQLTDGELFYIIEHGVKLTGMPAWGNGTSEGETASWHLVQFIRLLPSLGESEIAEMEALNPRSAAEWRGLEEERRFLEGDTAPPPPTPEPHRHK
jgi:mono/diheme cytochrome c family protein